MPAGSGVCPPVTAGDSGDRAIERPLKGRENLGVTDGNMLDMPYCPKPKKMLWRTRARLVGVVRLCFGVQI